MEVWKLVMPWLDSQELGKLAQTCRASGEAVRCLTECRVADASQGHESMAVPIVNDVDDFLYPNFYYTPFCRIFLSLKDSRTHWGFSEPRRKLTEAEFGGAMTMGSVLLGVGCNCSDICTSSENGLPDYDEGRIALEQQQRKRKILLGCRCGRLVGGQTAYDEVSRLSHITKRENVQNKGTILDHTRTIECFSPGRTIPEKEGKGSHELQNIIDLTGDLPVQEQPEDTSSLTECGPACSCCSNCKFRVSQHGVSVKLKVVRTKNKGWSLCASQRINQGTFVCEYAGELITNVEARQRHMDYDSSRQSRDSQGSALLVLREHLPSGRASLRVNVDATRIGNVARFINHSCDGGNLVPCIIRQAGCLIPKLALFAMRSISDGEELTYSYGTGAEVIKYKPCLCGTSACSGTLPSEMT